MKLLSVCPYCYEALSALAVNLLDATGFTDFASKLEENVFSSCRIGGCDETKCGKSEEV